MCQCPLGLVPHFYQDLITPSLQWKVAQCQCPLGLVPHFYHQEAELLVIEDDECQCPLGLVPHFYVPLQKPRFYAVSRASFCRYLSEYFDNS